MNKMKLSLNCLILGQALEKSLTENIGETYKDDDGVVIEFSKFTVSNFKEKLFRKGEVKAIVQNTGEMDLWKVDSRKVEEENNLEEFTESDIKEKLGGEKMIPRFPLEDYFKATNKRDIHVFIVPTATGNTYESSSIPIKRKSESESSNNRAPVDHFVREFWNHLCEAKIILKLPDYVDKTKYSSEPYSKYMSVEGNEIVLGEHIMLNSRSELIHDNGVSVTENITMDFEEKKDDETKLRPLVKFLRFHNTPEGVVYGIDTQEILIKTSYLQMIEEIENDRVINEEKNDKKKGCIIIGSPGIGKTHFSLYFAFYITRRYFPADFIYQQSDEGGSHTIHVSQQNMNVIEYPRGLKGEFPTNSFYIADSVIPSLCPTKFTLLATTPKNDRWHEFDKQRVQKYYAPIWIDEEIWDIWEWDRRDYKHKIPKERVEELITRWGCIPRRIFNEYDKEPKISDIVSQCDAYMYLRNEGGDLKDNYSGKAIHIYPSSDFKDKQYVIASKEMLKALYDHYAKNTKDIIINVIRNFAKTAGGPLAGKLFEMMAHDILRNGGKFKVRRLTKDSHEDPDEKLPVEELSLKGLTCKQFRKIDEISSECYNIPDSPNFKSIDSIAPDCDGTHYLYQMTIADKHSIKIKGLSDLESKINDYKPINLYFVVPDINDLFDDFCEQEYVTIADTKYVGWNYTTTWIEQYLTQYVLRIDLSDF